MRLVVITIFFLNFSVVGAQADDFYIGGSVGASQFNGTADADANQFGNFDTVPSELSINGLPFESTETAWSAYAGWFARKWLALEVGYADLGDSGRENPVFFALDGTTLIHSGTSLKVEELYLGARLSAPLSPKMSANWFVGLAKASFDTNGFLPVLTGSGIFDAAIERIPFVSPEDETGLVWGFGFDLALSERLALDVAYRQHNTQVLDIDTLTLGVTVTM